MQITKPVYRIGAAGLDPRDWRLIEIVFKHSQYNRFEFVLTPGADPASIDILIANTNDAQGVQAVSAVRRGTRVIPVIAAVPRGSPGAARHAISIDRLTLQLLPILNRVVELDLLAERPAPVRAPDKLAAASPAPATAIVSSPHIDAQVGPLALSEPAAPAVAVAGAESGDAASDVTPSASAGATVLPIGLANNGPAANGSAMNDIVSNGPATNRGRPNSNLFAFPKGNALSPPPPAQLRVLLVDDSPTVQQQLVNAVTRMGLASEVVGTAALALESLERTFFDVILLDVVLPDMDGYKLTRVIKRNKQHRQIPLILLTSRTSPLDLARGVLAGCDAYLTKPVPLQALEKALFRLLRKSLAIDDISSMLRPVVPADTLNTHSSVPLAAVHEIQPAARR